MRALDRLNHELDAWEDDTRVAGFWWRDDDLGVPRPELDPLLRTAATLGIEPLLAVVPRWATPDLPRYLVGAPARVAVHGWAHVDHEAGRAKKAEFGGARPITDLVADARSGREKLMELFGDALVACFVPPWNRMTPEMVRTLPGIGFRALSIHGRRPANACNHGLSWVNTHVDVIDWRGDRRFVGADVMATNITAELVERRRGPTSTGEPVGLLTHHLAMTAADWREFETVCAMLVTHPAAKMLTSRDLFERRGVQ
jgi:hypothetical protein